MNRKIDIGKDLNLLEVDPKDRMRPTTSLLLDDLPKTSEETLQEAKKRSWINWVNSEPLLMGYQDDQGKAYLFFISDSVKNKIVLLDVWDYTLLPSKRSLSYVNEWHRRYSNAGLLIIGVHTPMFEFGKDKKNILFAVKELDIQYPVVMDNDHAIWKSLENRYWPRRILFDQEGKVREDHTGEGLYQEMEGSIQLLLRNLSPGLSCPPVIKPVRKIDDPAYKIPDTTPEIFLGTRHNTILGNSAQLTTPNQEVFFQFKDGDLVSANMPYFEGKWVVTEESMHGTSEKGSLKVHILFQGTDAYLVGQARPKSHGDIPQFARVTVSLNDKPVTDDCLGADLFINEYRRSVVVLKDPKLYHLITNLEHKEHRLTFTFEDVNQDTLELFAFFFEHNA